MAALHLEGASRPEALHMSMSSINCLSLIMWVPHFPVVAVRLSRVTGLPWIARWGLTLFYENTVKCCYSQVGEREMPLWERRGHHTAGKKGVVYVL